MTPLIVGLMAALALDGAALRAAAPDSLPLLPAAGVRDPVFAVLVALALDRHEGVNDAARLQEAIRSTGRPTKLPLALLVGVTRQPIPGDSLSVAVEARFTRALDLPVPYKILVYHPGSFRGSPRLLFRELELGALALHHDDYVEKKWIGRTLELSDVRLYLLEEGNLSIDIDGWLDRLAGEKLDDTFVNGLVIFRMNGALYGTAIGHNRRGEGRSGTLAFADDRLIYPNSPELKTVARALRVRLEQWAKEKRLTPALQPEPAVADPE